jgi:shikimate kinase
MNIFLIGHRCTGKTTVGRILAESMSLRYVDTDNVIVSAIGESIRVAVEENGWDYFRRWEAKIMAQVCADDGQVVGTGGGVILNPENTAAMRRNGLVIWLKADPETIIKRMKIDDQTRRSRPSLTGKASSGEVVEILSQRGPLYRQASDIAVVTDNLSPEMVADDIIRGLVTRKNDDTFQGKREQK